MKTIEHDHTHVDRRGFLKCMSWAGTAAVWTIAGGVLKGVPVEAARQAMTSGDAALRFAQLSDSHIGFDKAANPDVTATLRAAVAKIKSASSPPAFVLHTGDLTHLSKPAEFDTLAEIMTELAVPVFYVPGEHDMLEDDGRSYLERFGNGTQGAGWHSFDLHGVHFIGLVNVVDLKAGGLGSLGPAQLKWLEQDVKRLKSSTPIVLFAHIPLWSVYPEWGWGTEDSARALALLKRFGSVSVLNGHIHQVMQKVEGHVTFHTAMSTAFPQPAPGSAPGPGPMKVEADRLRKMLGLAQLSFRTIDHPIAITDLALEQDAASGREVQIDNFRFTPTATAIAAGADLTWTNRDDMPHRIVDTNGQFTSPVLDTNQRFTRTFNTPGTYRYYCSLHPKMTGEIVVT
jgi:plastocyanin